MWIELSSLILSLFLSVLDAFGSQVGNSMDAKETKVYFTFPHSTHIVSSPSLLGSSPRFCLGHRTLTVSCFSFSCFHQERRQEVHSLVLSFCCVLFLLFVFSFRVCSMLEHRMKIQIIKCETNFLYFERLKDNCVSFLKTNWMAC